MRFLPTKIHGLLDYLMGIALTFSPFLLWSTGKGADMWIPILLGASMIILSVWTDYEWGAFRSVSMRTHLMIDLASGFLLALSPWLFGFAERVWAPHLIFGVAEIVAALVTQLHPSRRGALGPGTL